MISAPSPWRCEPPENNGLAAAPSNTSAASRVYLLLLAVAVGCAMMETAYGATATGTGSAPTPKSSSAWPARFPRTLMTARDVAAAKATAAARPPRFNLLPWQAPMKNQGARDTCYAFAFTAGLEAAYRHKYGKVVDGHYQGPQWILSEEFIIHIAKSTLLNIPQTYLFENPSSYLSGVLGVVGDPMMISVLSEQLMNYRTPESQYAPDLPLDSSAANTPLNSPPGVTQLATANNCSILMTLNKKWIGTAPKLNQAGQCVAGNCATQQAVDACEYAPSHISSSAVRNARFGISFEYKAPDASTQPGAKALSKEQMSDTDLLESLLFEGHEIITELFLDWKRGDEIKTSFQTSPLWNYDATVNGGGHNMLLVGYDRSDPSPSRWYFIMKNSWGGDKYYFVSYEFMRKATRGGVIILDVVDPGVDTAASLVRSGAWLGIWPVHRSAQSDLDGNLVIRRTFDPNVPVQPKPGTNLQLGDYYPSDGSSSQPVGGYLSSGSTMAFRVNPNKKGTNPVSYTWAFGQQPQRSIGR
jgi:hypothetical protein